MFSIRSWGICGFVCIVMLGVYLAALNWMAWHTGRAIVRDTPALAVVPQPLTNRALADLSSGTQIEQFGYSFRVPWPKAAVRRELQSITSIGFDGGASVLLMDPATTANPLDVYRGSPEQGTPLRKILGEEAFESRFDFVDAELQISPRQLGLFHGRLRNTRATILLGLKAMNVFPGTTAIYPILTNEVRGFQVGDPRTTPRMIRLLLFDYGDRQIEVVLRSPMPGPVMTQEQINAIVASFHPSH